MPRIFKEILSLSAIVLFFGSNLLAQDFSSDGNYSPRYVPTDPKGSDTLFVNGTGDDFDKSLFRAQVPNGRAKYTVTIDRFYSNLMEFDANGLLTNSEDLIVRQLIPKTATLTLRVFDVDIEGVPPEIDYVFVNGKQVTVAPDSKEPFKLSSGNKTFATLPIKIPIAYLKFPRIIGTETTKPSAENIIEIEIDANNIGTWKVLCDWISIEIKSPLRPVVMIHGFTASPASWITFSSLFNLDGIPNFAPAVDPIGSIFNNANAIAVEIPKILNRFGVDKVNLLAHSKGGLDSRLYLRKFGSRNNVESLIQLATPNHGSEAADKLLWFGKKSDQLQPAAEQLAPSWLRDNFNFRPVNDIIHSFKPIFTEKKYKSSIFILTGTKFALNKEKNVFFNPFDGIVSALSTTLPWNDLPPSFPFAITANNMYPHVPFSRINNGEFQLDHSEMHENGAVYQQIKLLLKPFGLSNLNNSQSDNNIDVLNKSVVFTDTSISRIIYNKTDSLRINEQRIININIDTTSSVNFLTMNMTGGFSFSLKDPNNFIIDSTSSNYFSTFNEFGKIAQYDIVNPEVGNWQLIIDPEAKGRLILNEVSVVSNKYITVSTDSVRYSINQSFPITSEFIDGTQSILGANVNAEILKHNGSIDSLSLFDDGTHGDPVANDGKYTNIYQGTNIPGTLDIKSTGTKGNISRVFTEHVAIIPNSASFNGTYNESSIDSDGNGLIDTLVINVGVMVNTAGNYFISANLNHSIDTTVTSATFIAVDSTKLNTGLNTIKLLFVGSEIFNSGFDGPYLLSNVTITDLQHSLQVDFSEQPFTTQAYTITQFQRPLLSLIGNIVESTSLDNGKISFIKVDFDVDILVGGTIEIAAELTDTNGNYIIWDNETFDITSSDQIGANTLSLFFSGNEINKKKINGPYLVKNLAITTTLQGADLFIKQLYRTSNYNYKDFTGGLIVANVINTVTYSPIRNAMLSIKKTSGSPNDTYFASDTTNINGQVFFTGTKSGDYDLYAVKDSVSSDTLSFSTLFQDSVSVTINMTFPNTLPVFTNLPDTLIIPSNSNNSITLWDFISDNESSDTSLVFDFNATPDTLNLSFNDTTGVLTISSEDSTYSGNVILRIRADDTYGGVVKDSILINFTSVTGIDEIQNIIPKEFSLSHNYPNPFNPTSNIKFGLPIKSNVEIIIYNGLGQQVVKLVNKEFSAGFHTLTFNANKLASGVYFYRIIATNEKNNFIQSKKMILLK